MGEDDNPWTAPNCYLSNTDPGCVATTERGVWRRTWIAWLCAAPMPLIGVGVGLHLSMAALVREVEAQSARSPGDFVCGNATIPFLFFGLIGGGLGGIVAGAAVARLVSWMVRGCDIQGATEALTFENFPTDDLVATESKRKKLQSETDLVERLIIQAERGGDEEVISKLIDYQARLRRELDQ